MRMTPIAFMLASIYLVAIITAVSVLSNIKAGGITELVYCSLAVFCLGFLMAVAHDVFS